MMGHRKTKNKKKKGRSRRHKIEHEALEHASVKTDCLTLMKTPQFGGVVTLLMQLLTLFVIGLLSVVLSLLGNDSTAISYISFTTLVLTLLVYELGITHWNPKYRATFRLILFWNLWLLTSVLFKLYAGVAVFGRVMAVLVSVVATVLAVTSLFTPKFVSIYSFLTVLLLLFPLRAVGIFEDSILILIARIIIYILTCIVIDRLLVGVKNSLKELLVSSSCFWILLCMPHFWISVLLIIAIIWYKSRRCSEEVDIEKALPPPEIEPERAASPPPSPQPPIQHKTAPYKARVYEQPVYEHGSDVGGTSIDLSVLDSFFQVKQ